MPSNRPLGENQLDILWSLQDYGPWHDCGCGWMWDTKAGTIRLLDSLVRRGLIRARSKKIDGYPFVKRTWRINPSGVAAWKAVRTHYREPRNANR